MKQIRHLLFLSFCIINAVHGSDDERSLVLQSAHQIEPRQQPSPQPVQLVNPLEARAATPVLVMHEIQTNADPERTPSYYGLSGSWDERDKDLEEKENDEELNRRTKRVQFATAAVMAAHRRSPSLLGEYDEDDAEAGRRRRRFHRLELQEERSSRVRPYGNPLETVPEELDEEELSEQLRRIKRCCQRLDAAHEEFEDPSEITLPSATASAASAAFTLANAGRVRTKGLETGLALVGAGVFVGTFFVVWWGEGLVGKIMQLKPTLERLKDRLITMEEEIIELKRINADLTERFTNAEGLLEDARDGIAAATQVSGDNARIAGITQEILQEYKRLERGYQILDQRLRTLAEHLPQEERDALLKEHGDVDMSNPSPVIPEDLQIEAARKQAVKRYNKQFKFQRWNRVETFTDIPIAIRLEKYRHLMSPEETQAAFARSATHPPSDRVRRESDFERNASDPTELMRRAERLKREASRFKTTTHTEI